MTEQMFVDSLRNRIRAMNTLWERAISDLTLDQVNHHERSGVLPIAFSFSHYDQLTRLLPLSTRVERGLGGEVQQREHLRREVPEHARRVPLIGHEHDLREASRL